MVRDLVELNTRINDPESSSERPTTSNGQWRPKKIQLRPAAVAPDNLESNPSARCQEPFPNGWQWTKESALPMTHKAPLGWSRNGTDTDNVSQALWSRSLFDPRPSHFESGESTPHCKHHPLRPRRKNPPRPTAGSQKLTSPKIWRLTTAANGLASRTHALVSAGFQSWQGK